MNISKTLTILAIIGIGAIVYAKYKESQSKSKDIKVNKQ